MGRIGVSCAISISLFKVISGGFLLNDVHKKKPKV